jgi:hypothetical protein
MKHKKTITSVGLLLLGLGGLHAQESPTAAGGEATGTGGSSSYSLGQVVYTTATGTNGSVAQGVQQPYEISIITGVKETTIHLEMNVYPNPTTNYLTLKVDASTSLSNQQLSYQVIDLQGKVIKNKKVSSTTTSINVERLPKAIYFLKVTKDNQLIKSFKIIKN